MVRTYSIWKIAPNIADDILYDVREIFSEDMDKIEVRFYGKWPNFVSILHLKNGDKYAIKGNADDFGEDIYEHMGFDYSKYESVSDAVKGVYLWWVYLSYEDDLQQYKIKMDEYTKLRDKYNEIGIVVKGGRR